MFAVSEKLRRDQARYAYRQFIGKLSASNARFVALGQPDPPIEIPVHVSREEMLNAYLTKYPEQQVFRDYIASVDSDMSEFVVNETRWKDIAMK